jgi:hypothetical protein
MKHIDKAVEKSLRRNPAATLRAIIRTAGQPTQFRETIERRGLHVVYVSTLINALTVEGKASAILALCEEDWVVTIELDKPVHIM